MTDVNESVAVPPGSSALANGLAKLFTDILAAKKSGLTGVALITAGVTSAIADLEPALVSIGTVESEVVAEPIGVAEAFALAGFQVARTLTGK